MDELNVAPNPAATQQAGAQAQTGAVAQPQTDAEASQQAAGADADASNSEDQGPADAGLTEEQKTIKRLQKRIDRLTAGRGAATREAQILREQIAAITTQHRGNDDDGGEDRQQQRLDPREIDRLATERAQEIVQRQSVAQRAQAVLAQGSKLPGFDDAVATVSDFVPFTDRSGRPTPFIEAVLDADKPAQLLHFLGQNPDEAERFAGLTPAQIGRKVAQLEARLERDTKAKPSTAPQPLQPIASRGGNSMSPRTPEDLVQELRGLRR